MTLDSRSSAYSLLGMLSSFVMVMFVRGCFIDGSVELVDGDMFVIYDFVIGEFVGMVMVVSVEIVDRVVCFVYVVFVEWLCCLVIDWVCILCVGVEWLLVRVDEFVLGFIAE